MTLAGACFAGTLVHALVILYEERGVGLCGVEFGGFAFCDGGFEFLLLCGGDALEAAGGAAGDYLGVFLDDGAEFGKLVAVAAGDGFIGAVEVFVHGVDDGFRAGDGVHGLFLRGFVAKDAGVAACFCADGVDDAFAEGVCGEAVEGGRISGADGEVGEGEFGVCFDDVLLGVFCFACGEKGEFLGFAVRHGDGWQVFFYVLDGVAELGVCEAGGGDGVLDMGFDEVFQNIVDICAASNVGNEDGAVCAGEVECAVFYGLAFGDAFGFAFCGVGSGVAAFFCGTLQGGKVITGVRGGICLCPSKNKASRGKSLGTFCLLLKDWSV